MIASLFMYPKSVTMTVCLFYTHGAQKCPCRTNYFRRGHSCLTAHSIIFSSKLLKFSLEVFDVTNACAIHPLLQYANKSNYVEHL